MGCRVLPRLLWLSPRSLEFFHCAAKTYTWRMTVVPRTHSTRGNLLVVAGQDQAIHLFDVVSPKLRQQSGNLRSGLEVAQLRRDPATPYLGTDVKDPVPAGASVPDTADARAEYCNVGCVEAKDLLISCGRSPNAVVSWSLEKLRAVDRVPGVGQPNRQCFALEVIEESSSSLPCGVFAGTGRGEVGFWSLRDGLASNGATPHLALHLKRDSARTSDIYDIRYDPLRSSILVGGIAVIDHYSMPEAQLRAVLQFDVRMLGRGAEKAFMFATPIQDPGNTTRIVQLGADVYGAASGGEMLTVWNQTRPTKSWVVALPHSCDDGVMVGMGDRPYEPSDHESIRRKSLMDELERVAFLLERSDIVLCKRVAVLADRRELKSWLW